MVYKASQKVICRKTGKTVGTLQSDNLKVDGVPSFIFYDTRYSKTVTVSNAIFNANYRLEDCK